MCNSEYRIFGCGGISLQLQMLGRLRKEAHVSLEFKASQGSKLNTYFFLFCFTIFFFKESHSIVQTGLKLGANPPALAS